MLQQPVIYLYAMLFSVSGYLGIQIVLTLVQTSGALVAVTVTTCRKAVTIIMSFVFFTKPFTIEWVLSKNVHNIRESRNSNIQEEHFSTTCHYKTWRDEKNFRKILKTCYCIQPTIPSDIVWKNFPYNVFLNFVNAQFLQHNVCPADCLRTFYPRANTICNSIHSLCK